MAFSGSSAHERQGSEYIYDELLGQYRARRGGARLDAGVPASKARCCHVSHPEPVELQQRAQQLQGVSASMSGKRGGAEVVGWRGRHGSQASLRQRGRFQSKLN